MNKTTKIILGIVVAIIVIGGIWYGASKKPKETIKIGVIGPLTGDIAEYGQNIKNAVDLALEEINNTGGINGRKLQLIYEDHACEPSKAVTAIRKLINIDKVDLILSEACSSPALAMAPIAEQEHKLLMLCTESNYKIKDAGDYIFRVYPSDAFQGKKLAEMISSKEYKNVALIYINNDYGLGLKKVFEAEFLKLGGKTLITETHQMGATDFRSQITKIKATKPEVIVLAEHPKDGALIMKQLQELGVNVPIYGSDAMKDEVVIQTAGSAAENLITVFPVHPKGADYDQFELVYKNKYGKIPEGYALYGYDALKLIALIIDKVGLDPIKIKDELYKVKDYKGVTGVIGFDDFGERISVDYNVYMIKNGQFVPYEE